MGYSQENATTGDTLKDIFLITSGCCRPYGVFSYQEKFQQTLDTINSIHRYSPGSDIVLVEASNSRFPEVDRKILEEHCEVYEILDAQRFITDWVSADTNQFKAKTSGELLAMEKFFELMSSRFQNYRRMFKICGRYQLTLSFGNMDYDNRDVIIRQPQLWGRDSKSNEREWIYPLRLWSWHSSLTAQLSRHILSQHQWLLDFHQTTQQIHIIEKLVYLAINNDRIPVREVAEIGVMGRHGQDGREVRE